MTSSLAMRWLLPCVAAASVVAQQPDLAVVRGRAVDRDGKPVEGCVVGLFERGERFTTKELFAKPLATTDAAGRYELRAKKNSSQDVVVTTKDHQVCVQHLRAEASAEHVLPDALMLPGTTLRGRVRDAAGKPIAGALVRVEDPLARDFGVMAWFASQAVSDERGIFEVPGVPRTGLLVTASALGFPAVSRFAAHDSPLDLTLVATGVVRGRVVGADGKPAANVEVNAITVEQRPGTEQVAADGDGSFLLTAPRTFRFRVSAYERVPPYRSFTSGLLSGPADDVAVTAVATKARESFQVTLHCVDAATKAKVVDFHASWSSLDSRSLAQSLMYRHDVRKPYHDEAVFDIVRPANNTSPGTIIVDAPGHGFAVVPIPENPVAPLVAELPAECVLVGQVIDDVTGKPAAGCAVRALPHWGIIGPGPDPWKTGVITGANGRYRIGGLAAGDYDVQVYDVGRQASESRLVSVSPDQETSLDLAVPEPLFFEFELIGDVPRGCLGSIMFAGVEYVSPVSIMLEGPLPALPIVPLGAQRSHRLGPAACGQHSVQLRLPTRDRLGAALTIPLGQVERGKLASLELPDLRQVLHTGRVHLPSDVPAERIAVLAHKTAAVRPARGRRAGARAAVLDPFGGFRQPFAVCLASNGSFVIDLPPGSYALQLVDLETKLVFHTEEHECTLEAEAGDPIEITPAMRWLQIDLVPAAAGAPVVIQEIQVEVPAPKDSLPAMLGKRYNRDDPQVCHVNWRGDSTQLRWLVPRTGLTLLPIQAFRMLSPSDNGCLGKAVDPAVVEAGKDAVHVTLRIPAPPDDAMIVAPQPK